MQLSENIGGGKFQSQKLSVILPQSSNLKPFAIKLSIKYAEK
jgi:hypothetical protein